MKKQLLKILIYVSILSMLLTLSSGFAYAVDPVSATTMANALAQAITAYGASHGVSMTFDVATTNGIGQGMHELWDDFKYYVNDNNVPTYDSLANTMWATIYTKIGNYIGININDTEIPYIDAFWNWLLSGPAEMTKVDNQYYEWSVTNGVVVSPVVFISLGAALVPYGSSNYWENAIPLYIDGESTYKAYVNTSSWSIYAVGIKNQAKVYFAAMDSNRAVKIMRNGSYVSQVNLQSYDTTQALYYGSYGYHAISQEFKIPTYDTLAEGLNIVTKKIDGTYVSDRITVTPYIGDDTPQDIYIPDNEDVNYAPLPYVGGIDINWDDTLFGDGTGTLTDAQKQEIADTIDDDITQSIEKTITLSADDPDPDSPTNEVYIPFLPLQLPSFNFSLSGIWHYVVTWVGTLGSWFTAMFNMWSCLPYAMVVPVYATLVVVIVFGVYRRFLS